MVTEILEIDSPEASPVLTNRRWPRRVAVVVVAGVIVAGGAFAFSTHQSDQDANDRLSAANVRLRNAAHKDHLRIDSQHSTISDQASRLDAYKEYATDAKTATTELSTCVHNLLDTLQAFAGSSLATLQAIDGHAIGSQCGTAEADGLLLTPPTDYSGSTE